MASLLLSLFRDDYSRVDIDDVNHIISVPHYKTRVELWKKKPYLFHGWVKSTEQDIPMVLAIPANNAKISFLSCVTMDDSKSQVLGLRGFSPFSKASVSPDDLFDDLVSKAVSKKVRELKLPTTKQLLAATSALALTEIVGEGTETIESAGQEYPSSITWPGVMMDDMVEGKTSVAAVDLLWACLESLRKRRDRDLKDHSKEEVEDRLEDVLDHWSHHFFFLWIIAKGGATAVTVRQQFDRANSQRFEQLVLEKWTRSTTFVASGRPAESETESRKVPPRVYDAEDNEVVTEEDIARATDSTLRVGLARGNQHERTLRFAGSEPATDESDDGGGKQRATSTSTRSERNNEEEVVRGSRSGAPRSNSRSAFTTHPTAAAATATATSGQGDGDDDDDDEDPLSGEEDDAELARHRQIKRRRLAALRLSDAERSKVLAEVTVENQFLTHQKAIFDQQRKSATSQWTIQHRRLVNMLSLPDDGTYPRKEPVWTQFAKSFFRDKAVTHAQNIMAQAAKRTWPGTMLKTGVITLLSQGFAAPQHRREQMGFSAFHFAPIGYDEELSQKEKEQIIRTGHGDGELSEELVKEYAKKKFFIPFRADEAAAMLDVCLQVLGLLCGKRSLATLPYRLGREILNTHRHEIHQALDMDKFYLVKYLYFMDGVFQNVVRALLRCLEFGKPTLQAAAIRIHLLPQRDIEDVLKNFLNNGIPVALPTPSSLVARSGSSSGVGKLITIGGGSKATGGDGGGGGKQSEPKGSKTPPKADKIEPWHRENPSPVAVWAFPANSPTKVFFPIGGNFNKKFPNFQHHVTGESVPMCIKYQTLGECFRGAKCRLSHIAPDDMSKLKRDVVDKIMAEQRKVAVDNKLME